MYKYRNYLNKTENIHVLKSFLNKDISTDVKYHMLSERLFYCLSRKIYMFLYGRQKRR